MHPSFLIEYHLNPSLCGRNWQKELICTLWLRGRTLMTAQLATELCWWLAMTLTCALSSLHLKSVVCFRWDREWVWMPPKDFIFVVRVSQVRRNRVATVDTQSLLHTNQCSHSRNQASEYIIEQKAHYNSINSESRNEKLKRKQKLLGVDRNTVWWVTCLPIRCRDLNLDSQNPCQSGYVWSPTSTSSTLLVRHRQGLQSKLAR